MFQQWLRPHVEKGIFIYSPIKNHCQTEEQICNHRCTMHVLLHYCIGMIMPVSYNELLSVHISLMYQHDDYISNLGLLGDMFSFFSNSNRIAFYKQSVKTLSRCSLLWLLIWACTVCLCPIANRNLMPSYS